MARNRRASVHAAALAWAHALDDVPAQGVGAGVRRSGRRRMGMGWYWRGLCCRCCSDDSLGRGGGAGALRRRRPRHAGGGIGAAGASACGCAGVGKGTGTCGGASYAQQLARASAFVRGAARRLALPQQGRYLSGSYVTTFILATLLAAFDFWTVKNISGRPCVAMSRR